MASPAVLAQIPPGGGGGGGGGGGALPDPPAHAQFQYPLPVDVIAGSVVTLNVGKIMDQDTLSGSGQLVGDPWWTYSASATDGVILQQIPGPQNDLVAALTVIWQAPDIDGPVTLNVTATDVDTPPGQQWPPNAIDAPVSFPAYTIHVHQLEVWKVWGGRTMYRERDATYSLWHRTVPEEGNFGGAWTCLHLDNDPTRPVPYLKFERGNDPGVPPVATEPMLFDGSTTAVVPVQCRAVDGWEGTVSQCQIRLHAPWTPEGGVEFSATGLVTALPTGPFNTATDHPLDAVVSFYDTVWWNWKYDANTDRAEYRTNDHQLPNNPTMVDVATTHEQPYLPDEELTPLRVKDVCVELRGRGTDEALTDRAAYWAGARLTFNPLYWMGRKQPSDYDPVKDEDVWCLQCQGTVGSDHNPADCITAATLACAGLRLVGVWGQPVRLVPRQYRNAPITWEGPPADECWATDPNHSPYLVGYMAGDTGNDFEGALKVNGLYWTVFPLLCRKEHPQDIITDPSVMRCLMCYGVWINVMTGEHERVRHEAGVYEEDAHFSPPRSGPHDTLVTNRSDGP